MKTVRDKIYESAQQFEQAGLYFGHGTENALDEAGYLVFYALDWSPEYTDEKLLKEITVEEEEKIQALLDKRLSSRKPACYLTNEAWFAGLSFYVDESVLVPRSPIAELIEEQFQPWIDPDKVNAILDLCTGSGCIAIACASVFPEANVVASDISEAALKVAEKNRQQHQLEDRLTLLHSDLFSGIEGKFDIIVSNPPYVDAEDMANLPDEYHAEPELGLAAGKDGLDLVIPMLRDALEHLNPGGIVVIEVGNSEQALAELFPAVDFMWLDFEFGGQGVFLLEQSQLEKYHELFRSEAEKRHAAK